MRSFEFTITDELGIHARPAGLLVKAASAFPCNIKIAAKGKTADAKRIMGVMSLGVKQGDVITVTLEGEKEEEAATAMETFLTENL